jgi:hypothetical protein
MHLMRLAICVCRYLTSLNQKQCALLTTECGRCTATMPGHYGDKPMPKKGEKKPGKMMPPGMKKPPKKGK